MEHSEDEALDEFRAVPAQNHWAVPALLMATGRRESYEPCQEGSGKAMMRGRAQQAVEEGGALEAEGTRLS